MVTFLPQTGLHFGGCMVDTGGLGDANLATWPAAIERLITLEPKVVVPGHGDETTPALLERTLRALEARAKTPR